MQFNFCIVKFVNDFLHKNHLCPWQLIDLELSNFEF